jgi:hypothetical protein
MWDLPRSRRSALTNEEKLPRKEAAPELTQLGHFRMTSSTSNLPSPTLPLPLTTMGD